MSLQAAQGQATETFVYVVKGHDIEPLLGLEDTVALGILTINPEGAMINRVQTVPQSPESPSSEASERRSDIYPHACL